MLSVVLLSLVTAAVCGGQKQLRSCNQVTYYNSTTSVVKTSEWSAVVQVSLIIRGECYTFPKYIVYLSEAEGVYSCKGWTGDYRPSINHWNTTTTCDLPCDRAYNWTLVVVEADSGEVVYSKGHQFYTTDVQHISIVPRTKDAEITCHFAPGATCKGCLVQVELTDQDLPNTVFEEVEATRSPGSLKAMATSTLLSTTSNHQYRISAYDIEWWGNVSGVGVRLTGGITMDTHSDEHTYQNDVLTFIIISVGIILLIALISAGATMMVIVKRHSKRAGVSLRSITHRRQRCQQRSAEKKPKRGDCTSEIDTPIPPPIPQSAHTFDVPSSSGSTANAQSTISPLSPDSGVFATSDGSSTGNSSSIRVNVELHMSATVPDFDAVSSGSDPDAPPIPMRLAESSESIAPPIPPRSVEYFACAATPPAVPSGMPPGLTSLTNFCSPPIPPKPTIASTTPPPIPPKGTPPDEKTYETEITNVLQLPKLLPPRDIVRQNAPSQMHQISHSIATAPNPAYHTHSF